MNLQTIPNKPLTITEVLNHVRTHLLTQNAKCEMRKYPGAGPMCLYRHEGMSCAVGCLIPDEYYNSNWEENGVEELIAPWAQQFGTGLQFKDLMNQVVDLSNPHVKKLLEALQYIHDTCHVKDWTKELDRLNGCETWDGTAWIEFMDVLMG